MLRCHSAVLLACGLALTSAIAAAQDKPPQRQQFGLEFDGDDDRVVVDKYRYDGSYAVTLEAIALTHSDKKGSVFVDFHASGIGLHLSDGKWTFNVRDQTNYRVAGADVAAVFDKPYHLAGVFDGRQALLYVNGRLQVRRDKLITEIKPSGLPFFVGSNPLADGVGYQEGFHGRIDAVRLSRGVRYVKDFDPPQWFDKDVDTLVLLNLEEGHGKTAADSSGHGYHGTIYGATWKKLEPAKP